MTSEISAHYKYTYDMENNVKTYFDTLTFTYDEIAEAILLYIQDEIGDDETVISIDIPIELNDDGFIDVDVEFEVTEND